MIPPSYIKAQNASYSIDQHSQCKESRIEFFFFFLMAQRGLSKTILISRLLPVRTFIRLIKVRQIPAQGLLFSSDFCI
ncbi:hypothetical protein P175DRAFT_0108488 [Aspergillus ochraceoroseus IBT 24754]|uniref:Uncharacterized protein n=1 Tax=Aspergillus ochraceoroseus IBT 24754 TaxID=1392256 RepID=A0A2T5LM60_9EURO|nr:uncharacterized protein P175DRAFT_0108488 [Aspergillus ochraceoroseus IBT 24754]PTU17365.1 hypothetical protein P175DRAFT_0108488 [Aspergillus ochraceoroseus IBT 24754]